MDHIFIIIVNWNRAKDTLLCLKSLAKVKQSSFKLSIIVVDNNSTDDSVKQIEEFDKSIIVIKNSVNAGFAEGNNVGIKYAIKSGADYLLLLNNDTVVDSKFVDVLYSYAVEMPNAGILSPKIYFAKGFEFHKDRYRQSELGSVIWAAGGHMDWGNVYGVNDGIDEVDKGQFSKLREIDFATGACMFIPSVVIDKVGVFDPKYFAYFEDCDLSVRIKHGGYKLYYIPEAVIWHKVSQTSGIGSGLSDYFSTRNRLLFTRRYAPIRAKIAVVREAARFLVYGRKWQRQGVLDYFMNKFGIGSWK